MVGALAEYPRGNAVIGWVFVGLIAIGSAFSYVSDTLLWSGFSLLVATVAVLPPLSTGDWTSMVPWPLVATAAVAVHARALDVYAEAAGFLAITMLAFIVVVELDEFTPVKLSRRFAVAFGVLTTMAIEAVWIVAQFYSDRWLDSDFLSTQTELQEDIVLVTAVGVTVGVFYWYFASAESDDSLKPESDDPVESDDSVERSPDRVGTR